MYHNNYQLLYEAVRDHFAMRGEEIVRLDLLETVRRPFSEICIFNAHSSEEPFKIISKQTVHHEINRNITEAENQSVVEYNVLSRVYPIFHSIDNCSVPRPIAVFPEYDTYIMEFSEGEPLTDLFRHARYFASRKGYRDLQGAVSNCGKWLKLFQEFTGEEPAGVESLDGVVERCKQRLALIEKASDKRCPSGLERHIIKVMDKHLARLKAGKIIVTGRHSDFTPFNILANGDAITVIDFLGYQKEPLPVDILKYLIYLENDKYSLTCNRTRQKELISSFRSGYGPFPDVHPSVVLICEIMQRVVCLHGFLSRKVNWFHHKVRANSCIKMHVRWLRQCEETSLFYE